MGDVTDEDVEVASRGRYAEEQLDPRLVTIFVYSLTGNTQYLSDHVVVPELAKLGYEARTVDLVPVIRDQVDVSCLVSQSAAIGVASMTWDHREPPGFTRWALSLSARCMRDKPFFVFMTYSSWPGSGISNIERDLESRGGVPLSRSGIYIMAPCSWLPCMPSRDRPPMLWGTAEVHRAAKWVARVARKLTSVTEPTAGSIQVCLSSSSGTSTPQVTTPSPHAETAGSPTQPLAMPERSESMIASSVPSMLLSPRCQSNLGLQPMPGKRPSGRRVPKSNEGWDLSGAMQRFVVDVASCTQCGVCATCCPVKAISFIAVEGKASQWKIEIERERCLGCCRCFHLCPTGAMKAPGLEDRPQYRFGKGVLTAGQNSWGTGTLWYNGCKTIVQTGITSVITEQADKLTSPRHS